MQLLDLSQVMLANLMVQIGNHTNAQIQEGMLRHMVLNSIRMYNAKHRAKYGDMVIACDGFNTWRKQNFPYYKIRRKDKKNTELNWNEIFKALDNIRSELMVYMPYPTVRVEGAEADDIIATLAKRASNDQPVLILSGDKDFKQLQKFKGVDQFDPVKKMFIVVDDPESSLKELIVKGDSGDDVPNIMSPDDTFATKTRQKTMTAKRLEFFMTHDPSEYEPEAQRGFARNKMLIDLSQIPSELEEQIVSAFNEQTGKGRGDIMAYFQTKRLKNLIAYMGDF